MPGNIDQAGRIHGKIKEPAAAKTGRVEERGIWLRWIRF